MDEVEWTERLSEKGRLKGNGALSGLLEIPLVIVLVSYLFFEPSNPD